MRIGLVTPYPPRDCSDAPQSGEAWYSKKLAEAMHAAGHEVTVFSNRLDRREACYADGGVAVTRCWTFGPQVWRQLYGTLRRARRQLDVVHIQYAVFLYGGVGAALLFPFFLALLRLGGVPVVITLHQTVPTRDIDRHFQAETGIKGNLALLKQGLQRLMRLTLRLAGTVIVHEDFFRTVLVADYGARPAQVRVVPHGIGAARLMDQSLAREILGLRPDRTVVLFFGYLAKYKGLDNLIEAFVEMPDSRCQLLIAGGEHPRLRGKPEYAAYLARLQAQAARAPGRIMLTGFVPEPDVPLVFAAADVVVFPYTRAISSSGPLALSAAYGKAFLASESLAPIIQEPALLFPNTAPGLRRKLEQFLSDGWLEVKSRRYAQQLCQARQWGQVARQTLDVYRGVVPVPSVRQPEVVRPVRVGQGLLSGAGGVLLSAPPSSLSREGYDISLDELGVI